MPKLPPEYLTKKGKLRSILHVNTLWERRYGKGASPNKLTSNSKKRLGEQVAEVSKRWDLGESTAVQGRSSGTFNFLKSFQDTFYKQICPSRGITVLKDTIPFFPLFASTLFRRAGGFAESLHPSIIRAAKGKLPRASGSSANFITVLENLNKRSPPTLHGKALFIPYRAVENVYTPTVIAKLANTGILPERMVEWSKKPKHILETLANLKKKGELNEKALENLRNLGF